MNILVIASNRDQADYWMDQFEFTRNDYRHVISERDLRGMSADKYKVWFVGEYWNNKNYYKFHEQCVLRNLEMIFIDEIRNWQIPVTFI